MSSCHKCRRVERASSTAHIWKTCWRDPKILLSSQESNGVRARRVICKLLLYFSCLRGSWISQSFRSSNSFCLKHATNLTLTISKSAPSPTSWFYLALFATLLASLSQYSFHRVYYLSDKFLWDSSSLFHLWCLLASLLLSSSCYLDYSMCLPIERNCADFQFSWSPFSKNLRCSQILKSKGSCLILCNWPDSHVPASVAIVELKPIFCPVLSPSILWEEIRFPFGGWLQDLELSIFVFSFLSICCVYPFAF